MASVMVIGSEVFGRCVGEIDVSAVVKYGDAWLCCEWSYFRFIWAVKGAQKICKSVLRVGDGARYWSAFLVLW